MVVRESTNNTFIHKMLDDFERKLEEQGSKVYTTLDKLLLEFQKEYISFKTPEFIKQWKDTSDAHNSARQSRRPLVWDVLVKIIEMWLEKMAEEYNFKMCNDKQIKHTKSLTKEFTQVRNSILIHYDEYSFLPDGDIILYRKHKDESITVFAIISLKTSFRERFTETPYRKLKLMSNPISENIKVVMVTTDKDDEIWIIKTWKTPRKARVIMEYELDGIFIANERFEWSDKVWGIASFFMFIKNICNERK